MKLHSAITSAQGEEEEQQEVETTGKRGTV